MDNQSLNKTKLMVEEYQCPGCVVGSSFECYENNGIGVECTKHIVGTTIFPRIGRIFLGMPKGFCRLGQDDALKINIFNHTDEFVYDWLNVPVWKHLDKHGNTLVRGISPRINSPFLHIFIGDFMNKIDCHEITENDLGKID